MRPRHFLCPVLIAVVQHRTIIAGKDDHRVLCDTQSVKRLEDFTHTCIQFDNDVASRAERGGVLEARARQSGTCGWWKA